MSDASAGARSRPVTLRWVAAVAVWVEAAALAAAGIAYGVHALSLPQPMFAVGLAIFALSIAAGLGAAGRGIARGARWAVSAVLTWQALLTLAGASFLQSRPGLGVPATAIGVAVGVLTVVASRDVVAPRP